MRNTHVQTGGLRQTVDQDHEDSKVMKNTEQCMMLYHVNTGVQPDDSPGSSEQDPERMCTESKAMSPW